MADCRSLIEFLRAFEHHRRAAQPSHPARRPHSPNPACDHPPPLAAVDVILLSAVLAATVVLSFPYLKFIAAVAAPFAAPLAAVAAAAAAAAGAWELLSRRARCCGRPRCRGLRKAVEFDIQLETEECVRKSPSIMTVMPSLGLGVGAVAGVGVGEERKELEAELRKMAPPNGRTVLILRAPCGCAKGRMEVWGPRKSRRIKK